MSLCNLAPELRECLVTPSPEDRLQQIRFTAKHIEELVSAAGDQQVTYSEELVKTLHRLMTAGASDVASSEYRTVPVAVRHGERGEKAIIGCPPPKEVPAEMVELIEYLNRPRSTPAAMRERIAKGTMSFLRIHPFLEGNGRAGRALLCLRLRASGYLRDEEAVVNFLYDYSERAKQKYIMGDLIRRLVVDANQKAWKDYFRALFQELEANGGHLPPIDPSLFELMH